MRAGAGSEAVLPAYLVGMVLTPTFLRDRELPNRMRVVAFTILTPFYFLKAGSLVEAHAVAPAAGLTFGSISALFGLTNHIINQAQYTILVTAVIGSAVVPTLIAQKWFMPKSPPVIERGAERATVPEALEPIPARER